jgi:hypothetical protein
MQHVWRAGTSTTAHSFFTSRFSNLHEITASLFDLVAGSEMCELVSPIPLPHPVDCFVFVLQLMSSVAGSATGGAPGTVCRWGVLGCAGIARKVGGAIQRSANGTVAAVGSRSLERSTAWAKGTP